MYSILIYTSINYIVFEKIDFSVNARPTRDHLKNVLNLFFRFIQLDLMSDII